MSARVGTGRPSIAAISARTVVCSSSASASSSPVKTETSAPAEKSVPSARTSTARMSLAAASSTAAPRSASSSPLNRFSGGLSIRISPSRSSRWKVTSGISVAGVGGVAVRVLRFEPVASVLGIQAQDRRHRQLRIVGLHHLGPVHVLDLKRGLKVRVGSLVEGPLGVRHGHRRQQSDLFRQLERARNSIINDLVDQAEFEGDLRTDDTAPKHPVERTSQPDESRNSLRPATTRNDPGADLRVPIPEVAVLADPEIASQSQLETTPQRVAVQRRNRDLRQRRQPVEIRLEAAAKFARIAGTLRVAGDTEELLDAVRRKPCWALRVGSKHDCPGRGVLAAGDHLPKLVEDLPRHKIVGRV